jgi:hypothetical protein
MWAAALCTHLLFCVTCLLGVILTLSNLFAGRPVFGFAALTLLPLLLAAIRGAIRVSAVQESLSALKPQIQQQSWVHLVLGVGIPFLYLVNFVHSLFTRTIRWRGIRYELISPQQTRVLGR